MDSCTADGVVLDEMPDRCRSAALGFFAGVADGWDKRKLAAWLTGAYSDAVLATSVSSDGGDGRARSEGAAPIDGERIRELLARTREESVDVVLSLADPARAEHFGFYALVGGLVTQVEDSRGRPVWAPMAWPRMSLLDRVLSLVAADYLTRAAEYESDLHVCARCDSVSFDGEARESGACRSCRRPSGAVYTGRRGSQPDRLAG